MLRALKIWILMLMPAVAMLLTACINDDFLDGDSPVNGEEPAGDVFIRFRLSLGDGMASRAEVDSLTPGTDNENKINSIDILVFASENSGYKLIDVVYLDSEQIQTITKDPEGLVVPLAATKGQKLHIYAAVNLLPWMRSKFIINQCGTDVSLASDGADCWDVMNDFIPGSGGKSESLGASGIPMTGQFKLKATGSPDIEITAAQLQESNTLEVETYVSRIVAKVHLLAKTDETYNFYVNAKDVSHTRAADDSDDQYADWLGWMRLDSVRYMINGTNKSTYLFQQTQATAGGTTVYKDLNMSLAAYRNGELFDEPLWRRDFNFYDGISLHRVNISDAEHFGKAEAFDGTKLDNTINGGTDYSNGLYCLENYFDTPADFDFYNGQKYAMPVVTNLSIATKLTPKYLAVLTDFPAKLDAFFKEAADANYSAEFYKKYGITKDDLGKADAEHWNLIKKDYFGEGYLNVNPDPYVDHGLSRVFRKDFYIFQALNVSDAMYFINWSLIARGLWSGDDKEFENGKFPKDTYYVYDTRYDEASGAADSDYSQRYVYLVAGAVAYATGENMRIKTYSVPHVGGWGYFYTYIDDNKTTVNGVTPFTASQVTRNKYYIITVDNFGTPGGTITDPEYIKVNTVPVGWDYTGRGDINLH